GTAGRCLARLQPLTFNNIGTNDWLTTSTTGLTLHAALPIAITPGPATQLVFGTEPSTTVADNAINPAVKVRALDAFGNLATGYSGAVAIVLGNNPGGAILSGTKSVAAASGVATFFDLSLNKTGTDSTLRARDSG